MALSGNCKPPSSMKLLVVLVASIGPLGSASGQTEPELGLAGQDELDVPKVFVFRIEKGRSRRN
jgi:hypothetical protein